MEFHIMKYLVLILAAAGILFIAEDIRIKYLMGFVIIMSLFLMIAGFAAKAGRH